VRWLVVVCVGMRVGVGVSVRVVVRCLVVVCVGMRVHVRCLVVVCVGMRVGVRVVVWQGVDVLGACG
jgi:hypothetical protein